MAKDYGYFGKGSTGYAHYMQAFNRNFGTGGPGGGNHKGNNNGDGNGCGTGCLLVVVAFLVLNFIIAPAMYK